MSLIGRRINVEDKNQVMAIAEKTWEGHDYLPQVFDKWVADETGAFLALEKEGKVVTLAKITQHSAGEIWMEGLRVAADERGKGYAELMTKYLLWHIQRYSPQSIAFATGDDNLPSRHIGEKRGFALLTEYLAYDGKVNRRFAKWNEELVLRDDRQIYDYISASEILAKLQGYLCYGWTYKKLQPRLIEEFVRNGLAWGVADSAGLRALMLVTNIWQHYIHTSFLAGDIEHYPRLFAMLHQYAINQGQDWVYSFDGAGQLSENYRQLKLAPDKWFRSVVLYSLPTAVWSDRLPGIQKDLQNSGIALD
jgi:N-acetylglutamate synthase-like GNAT family acetyltransferase